MFKLLFGVLWLVFFLWAVVDIVQAKKDFSWKLIWLLICLIFPVGGVIGYYFIGHKKALAAAQTPTNQQPQ